MGNSSTRKLYFAYLDNLPAAVVVYVRFRFVVEALVGTMFFRGTHSLLYVLSYVHSRVLGRLDCLVLNDLNPVVVGICDIRGLAHNHLSRAQEGNSPSTNAMLFILPSVNRFFQLTPFSSNRAQALSMSSTETQMWPNP